MVLSKLFCLLVLLRMNTLSTEEMLGVMPPRDTCMESCITSFTDVINVILSLFCLEEEEDGTGPKRDLKWKLVVFSYIISPIVSISPTI